MNRVELEAADRAVGRRVNAAVGDDDQRLVTRNEAVAIFAGTGLPGHDVLRMLGAQAEKAAPHAEEGMPLVAVLQGVALNAYLLGYECGKRSS